MKRLLLLLLLACAASCKPSAQEQAGKFCTRVKPPTPQAQEQCAQYYAGLRGFAKDCIDDCTTTARDGDEFEGCRESCMGTSPNVRDVCWAMYRDDVFCVQHYVQMQTKEPKKYGCAARCLVRTQGAASCSATCGATAPPPSSSSSPLAPP